MPAALDVNWETIKMLAQQIGVREAARRMGLPEDAVRQRSAREGWLRDMPRSQPLPPSVRKVVTNVTKAPEASINYLKDVLLETRTEHAKTALAVAKDMSSWVQEQPSAMRDKDNAQALLSNAKHAALAGGWQDQAPTAKINLTVTGAENPVTLEAEVVSQDPDIDILADY
jgi:hypothetical protein